MPNDDDSQPPDPRSLIVFGVAVTMGATLLTFVAFQIREMIVLIYLAALVAVGLAPAVRRLERLSLPGLGSRHPPRWAVVLVLYAALSAVGTLAGTLLLPPLLRQTGEFATGAPALMQQAQRWMLDHAVIRERLSVGEMMQKAPVDGSSILLTVWGLIGGVAGFFTIGILSFYFLVESDGLFQTFIRLVPRRRRRRVRGVAEQITDKVSAWLNGQLMLAGVVGGLAALGLALLGVPYFFVLGLLTASGEVLPYVGPILAAVPGVALASTVSWRLAVETLALYVVLHLFEGNVLVPRIMESQLGLSAATTLVALLLGTAILGLPGAILAVPTAAILQVLLRELLPPEVE